MKKNLLLGFILSLFVVLQAFAQDETISGRITDAAGQGVPGATVLVKGNTSIGTATDANGNYTLKVPKGATLLVSYVGFKTAELPAGQTSVVLQDDASLTETTITGALGIERTKASIGYSATQVKTEDLNQAKAVNAFTGLSGKVAGLQINTTGNGVNPQTRVVLRGNRSLLGNNQALVVIDGSQVASDAINFLNPNDIESITVLKGANAASLYGADAVNGVLMVTTKKGSATAPRVTFSSTYQQEAVNFLPKFQNRFGQGTEAYSRVHIPFENQSFGPEFDGTVKPLGKTLEDGTIQLGTYSAKPDEKKRIWNTGYTSQNDISISAGDKNSTFYASLQDVKTKGIVPNDEYQRTGGRLSASTVYGKFKGNFNAGYTQSLQNRTTSDFYFVALNTAANIPITQYRDWQNFKNPDGSLNYANPNNYFNDYYANPFFSLDNSRETIKNNNITANVQMQYDILPWLSATYRLGINTKNFYQKSNTNIYKFRDFAKNVARIYNARDIAGAIGDYSGFETRLSQDFFLNAKKKFGENDKFSVDVILGSQVIDKNTKIQQATASALVIPGVYNISNITGVPVATESNTVNRTIGLFVDATIGYKDFLFLHGSIRRDETSLLPPASRVFYYPGADISFVASKAIGALQENNFLTYLKLTASYTRVGTVSLNPYSLQNTFPQGAGFPYGSTPGFTVGNTIVDPKLQPEFTNSLEFGLEATFFEKLNLELSYYNQTTTNQTLTASVSSATGSPLALVNAGEMANSGFEATVRGTILKTDAGFQWDANVNYAYRENVVKSLANGDINLTAVAVGDGNASIFAKEGYAYPTLLVTNYKRDPQGRVIVDPKTGYPAQNPNGLVIAGQTNPRHTLGVGTTLKYKGFTFNALAEYRGGYVVYHDLGHDLTFTGVAKVTEVYGRERFVFPNSVLDNGDGTFTPNKTVAVEDGGLNFWDNNYKKYGENYVTSGAFWKLRELSFTYNFPKEILENSKYFKSASIGFVGRNLLTLVPSSNQYTDPEFSVTTGNSVGINNSFNTPPTRTYGLNLTVGF